MKSLGATIKEYREAIGLSQRDLASRTGIHFTYLSKVENGAIPSLKVLYRLARVFGVLPSELVALSGKVSASVLAAAVANNSWLPRYIEYLSHGSVSEPEGIS